MLLRALALAVCCGVGALVNIVSAAYWSPAHGFVGDGRVLDATAFPEGAPTIGSFRRVPQTLPVWRPLQVLLEARSGEGRRTLTIDVPTSGGRFAGVVEAAAPATIDLLLTAPADERDGRVTFYCAADGAAPSVVLTSLRVRPVLAARPLLRYGVVGVVAGALFWLCTFGWAQVRARAPALAPTFVPNPSPQPSPRERGEAVVAREARVLGAAVILLLAAWAVIKPPLQAPDEPQHIMHATSLRLGPWVTGVQSFAVDPRHAVTLVWGVPNVLHGLIQRPERFLTRADVDGLVRQPHAPLVAGPTIPTATASYPPTFYWYVFGAAELARLIGLSPWQTLYVLRFAVVLLAATLWTGIFVTLRHIGYDRWRAAGSVALMLGVPMYAFLGSSVNPDAAAIPLAIWLALLSWQALRSAPNHAALTLVALALLLTKPSSIQVVLALLGAAAASACFRRDAFARAAEVARTLVACTLASVAIYYAWSPPSLSDGAGLMQSASQYVTELMPRIPELWVMYWGKLGWLEYQAPSAFYVVLLGLVLVSVAWMVYARIGWVEGAAFFGVFAALLAASTFAGEYASLHRTGHMLQGRYFLPGLVCSVPVMGLAPRPLRLALGATVAALHVTLFWLTFVRYWHGDAGAFLASLPY